MKSNLTLILGGARGGKSTHALNLGLQNGGAALFVATAEARDDDMAARISVHKLERPDSWYTLEEPVDLAGRIRTFLNDAGSPDNPAPPVRTIIIDCLTLWVSNLMFLDADRDRAGLEIPRRIKELLDLIEAVGNTSADTHGSADTRSSGDIHWIVVSNEVGMGIIPADPVSRFYRELLGRANQQVAQAANNVHLVIAGIPMELKPNNINKS